MPKQYYCTPQEFTDKHLTQEIALLKKTIEVLREFDNNTNTFADTNQLVPSFKRLYKNLKKELNARKH